MELIACICITSAASMHAKNKLHRLTRYTVRETRTYMRRYAICYAIYSHRLANAVIKQRIFVKAIEYNCKESFRFAPGSVSAFWLPNIDTSRLGILALYDITIVAKESLYMKMASPTQSTLLIWGKPIANVRMTCVRRGDLYRYRMKLPTRYNPLCLCCHNITHINVRLEQNYVGLRPECVLKKIIDHIKIKLLYRDKYVLHDVSVPVDLFAATASAIS